MAFNAAHNIAKLLENYHGTWMIAGGWAIDLFLNRETRDHDDIEITIPRNEQLQLQRYFRDWDLNFVQSGKLIPWDSETQLQLPIHEIHGSQNSLKIEVLLNEIENGIWKFRRNLQIEYPASQVVLLSRENLPIICPEVALLYKAKVPREKDEQDFIHTLPHLNPAQKNWLENALIETHGMHHAWVAKLKQKII